MRNGADGISVFNFAYYREHGTPDGGPFGEPPFDALKKMRDAELLARAPHHWFLAPGWNNPTLSRPPLLPRVIKAGATIRFVWDIMAPYPPGTRTWGRLRIQFDQAPPKQDKWVVLLNEKELEPHPDVSEPFPNPFPSMLGKPDTMLAWQVFAPQLYHGTNFPRHQTQARRRRCHDRLHRSVLRLVESTPELLAANSAGSSHPLLIPARAPQAELFSGCFWTVSRSCASADWIISSHSAQHFLCCCHAAAPRALPR